LQQKLCR